MRVMPRSDSKPVKDGWLEAGATYAVLFLQTFRQDVLVWSDMQRAVALFPLSGFDVVDRSIPESWVIDVDLNGCVMLGPARWLEDGFWDRYHEADPVAVEVFEEERARLA